MRKILRSELKKSELDGYWITDTLSALTLPTDMPAATLASCAAKIPSLMLSDNVHLSNLGYNKLGEGIVVGLEKALSKKGADCVVIGEKKKVFLARLYL